MRKVKRKLCDMLKRSFSTKREVKSSPLEELYKKTFNIESVKDLNVKLKYRKNKNHSS